MRAEDVQHVVGLKEFMHDAGAESVPRTTIFEPSLAFIL